MEKILVREDGSPFIKVTHSPPSHYIYVEWLGFLEFDMIKKGSEELLHTLRETKVEKVLISNQQIVGPWIQANQWYASNWNPRAQEAGLKYMAVIVSGNIFAPLSLKGFEKVNNGSYKVFSHFDPELALKWLLAQQ